MRDDGLTRPKWVERQFLRPRDFIAEQRYHLVNRWRHNIGLHSWGIVDGLDIRLNDGALSVMPGMAIDGYGRELVLSEGLPVPIADFDRLGTDALHLWLVYRLLEVEPPPAGFTGCRDDEDEADSPYRWSENPSLYSTDGNEDINPRSAPPPVPVSDLPFAPSLAFPVDGEPWSVYLGTITRNRGGDPPFEIDGRLRPYAGLVGGAIVHPAGRTRVELGSEVDSQILFSISTLDSSSPPQLVPRIELIGLAGATPDEPDDISLVFQEDVIVEGDVSVSEGTVWFKGAQNATPLSHPWQIYRSGGAGGSELRIEIGNNTGDSFQIGKWDAEERKFKACLTIDHECHVTVSGNLIVEGMIKPKGGIDPTDLTPQAKAIASSLTASQLSGLAADVIHGRLEGAVARGVQALIRSQSSLVSDRVTIGGTRAKVLHDVIASLDSEAALQELAEQFLTSNPRVAAEFSEALNAAVRSGIREHE